MLASSSRLDIFWSPSHRDNYIVFGSEITLYKVDKYDYRTANVDPQGMLSEDTYGKYLSHAESQFPKCMSWHPKADRDYLVAVGLVNGRITLTSLDQKKNDELIGKEFVPKHGRPCWCVSWNLDPSSTTMLAAGLDKYRTDTSLLIWDVNRRAADSLSTDKSGEESLDNSKLGKVIREYGSSEATYSLAWNSSNHIITGMNKYLRVIDLRLEKDKFACTTQTKAVFGICIDPQNEQRGIASYIENQVYIWDLRKFDKPIHTLPLQKTPIVKLGWCPKRLGLLACLTKESSSIRVFDLQHSSCAEYEQTFSERPVESPCGQQLASFDWHPCDENRLLTINMRGGVSDIKLFERIALDMNPCESIEQQLCYSQVKQFGLYKFDNRDDISSVMRQRAIDKYGLHSCHEESIPLLEMDPRRPEAELWKWADHLTNLIETDDRFTKSIHIEPVGDTPLPHTRFIGAKLLTETLHSKAVSVKWEGAGAENLPPLTHYQSVERDKCLKICRWPCKLQTDLHRVTPGKPVDEYNRWSTENSERIDPVTAVTSRLEQAGCFEKATAVALFHGRIDDALKILNRGAEHASANELSSSINLSIVAMALAGINPANNALWLSKCRELHNKIDNPYLRSTFSFLTCGNNYIQIISKSDISIADRVAFACVFLPDSELRSYLKELQNEVVINGDLSGVLVTGLDYAGVELLQKYIDKTGDIQTATLIIIHSFPSRIQEDERVKSWIKHYRGLLDKWKLWVLRAKFDIFHKKFVERATTPTVSQVYLSCHFCSKPIMPLQMQQRRMYNAGGYGQKSNTVKITVCTECRKPLPRCALCLKNMGTASGILSAKLDTAASSPRSADVSGDTSTRDGNKKKKSEELNTCAEFANWFTWCQSCHHGGHSVHIEDWFKSNIECPVSGCACKCASLDSIPDLEQSDLSP